MKPSLRLLLCAALFPPVASCSLRQPAVVTQDYALKLPAPSAGPAGARGITVMPFTAAPPASGQMLLYRTGDFRYESDFYNRFLAPPPQVLTGELRQWLAGSKAGAVRDPGSPLASDLIVQPRLHELYADYRDVGNPRAVVAMDIVLIGRTDSGDRQLFRRIYRREVPMKGVSPADAVEAWGKGAGWIFSEFTGDMRRAGT